MAAQFKARNCARLQPAVLIDGSRHQFLSGTAFAQDQNGDFERGSPANLLVNFLHGRRLAHDPIDFFTFLRNLFPFEGGRDFLQPAQFDRSSDGLSKLMQIDGLYQIFIGTAISWLRWRLRSWRRP